MAAARTTARPPLYDARMARKKPRVDAETPARATRAKAAPARATRSPRPARAAKPARAKKAKRDKQDRPDKKGDRKPGGKPDRKPDRKKDKKPSGQHIEVRRIHRRDLNKAWEFLKISFRHVNMETVEYQRPRSKTRFEEIYDDEGIEQLLFSVEGAIVAYAEASYEVTGSDNWINPRYFEKRDMRPLFVDELAVHPEWNGRGVGSFVLEQLHHLARVRGLTHIVLEVAENNENALGWYRKRNFRKLDAAIFMAASVESEPELLPPRELPAPRASMGPLPEIERVEVETVPLEDDDDAADHDAD